MTCIKPYTGKLCYTTREKGRLKDAFMSLKAQRQRCNNPKAYDYKWYGGKGIRVTYPTREFIGWFLEESKKFKREDKLSIDRLNHNKHYTFGNIQLVTRSENSREMARRHKSVAIVLYSPDNVELATFKDSVVAESITGYHNATIRHSVRNETSLRDGHYFRRK